MNICIYRCKFTYTYFLSCESHFGSKLFSNLFLKVLSEARYFLYNIVERVSKVNGTGVCGHP